MIAVFKLHTIIQASTMTPKDFPWKLGISIGSQIYHLQETERTQASFSFLKREPGLNPS